MTNADKIFNYPKEVILAEMTYEELQERYNGLKAINAKLDEATRDIYDYQYNLLCHHISQCFEEIRRRQAATPRKSDSQTGDYKPEPLSDELRALENVMENLQRMGF